MQLLGSAQSKVANSPRLLSPLELSLRATDNVQLLDSPAQGDPDTKTINKNINTEKALLMYKTNIHVLRTGSMLFEVFKYLGQKKKRSKSSCLTLL